MPDYKNLFEALQTLVRLLYCCKQKRVLSVKSGRMQCHSLNRSTCQCRHKHLGFLEKSNHCNGQLAEISLGFKRLRKVRGDTDCCDTDRFCSDMDIHATKRSITASRTICMTSRVVVVTISVDNQSFSPAFIYYRSE
ncbi:hypothetical protein TNCV_1599101 [Trichonephila clavipes]|nr:hypothetical protein TNCV_1599101 [Trichonephila clavipes]